MRKKIKADFFKKNLVSGKGGEILDERGRRNRPHPNLLQKILSFIGHFESISCLFVLFLQFYSRRVYLQSTSIVFLCNPVFTAYCNAHKVTYVYALFNIGKGSPCRASTSKRKFLISYKYNFKEADQNISVILEVPFPHLLLLMLD